MTMLALIFHRDVEVCATNLHAACYWVDRTIKRDYSLAFGTKSGGATCHQFAFSLLMITQTGDGKSVYCYKCARNYKSSAKPRMVRRPFGRPKS